MLRLSIVSAARVSKGSWSFSKDEVNDCKEQTEDCYVITGQSEVEVLGHEGTVNRTTNLSYSKETVEDCRGKIVYQDFIIRILVDN